MKQGKYIIITIFAILHGTALAVEPDYNGRSQYGAVYINEDRTTMNGSFGVRYRPGYRQEYSYIKTSFDGWMIVFQGYDSSTQRPFFCYTWNGRTSTYPWDNALDMAINAGNGTQIEVSRWGDAEPDFRHVCRSIKITKTSEGSH